MSDRGITSPDRPHLLTVLLHITSTSSVGTSQVYPITHPALLTQVHEQTTAVGDTASLPLSREANKADNTRVTTVTPVIGLAVQKDPPAMDLSPQIAIEATPTIRTVHAAKTATVTIIGNADSVRRGQADRSSNHRPPTGDRDSSRDRDKPRTSGRGDERDTRSASRDRRTGTNSSPSSHVNMYLDITITYDAMCLLATIFIVTPTLLP